jgi:hypothetical protein
VCGRDVEHPRVHRGILVTREADVADLPGLFCLQQCFERPAGCEESVRILHPDVLVVLHEIDDIRLQSLERLVDLRCR